MELIYNINVPLSIAYMIHAKPIENLYVRAGYRFYIYDQYYNNI